MAGAAAQQLQVGIVTGGLTNALAVAKVTYPNPLGIFPSRGWFSAVLAVIFIFSVITALLVVASVFVRRRGASVERREQIAWLGRRPDDRPVGGGAGHYQYGDEWQWRLAWHPELDLHGAHGARGRSAGLCGGGAEVPAV
jgi:hypothetical protein